MGLFGKLKDNFNHGGVKVQLQAPASVSMNDAAIPVTVTITSSTEPQVIENVRVQIIAESQNQAFGNTAAQPQQHSVALADYAQVFSLAAGESKDVQLSLVMNAGAAFAAQLPESSGLAQIAGMVSKLESVSEAMNGASYRYTISASAKIQGVGFGPAFSQPIQVLKPGQIGGGFNTGIHL